MLHITFKPESKEFHQAAKEYEALWAAEGNRITDAIESAAGLKFKEPHIEAFIFEGRSQSHPLKLRASNRENTKKAAVVHELVHRISYDYMLDLPVKGDALPLGLHKQIYLLLYDLWAELYGEDFANTEVQVESALEPMYKKAWDWALSFTPDARKGAFSELVNKLSL